MTVASAVTWVLVAWVGDPVRTATLGSPTAGRRSFSASETLVAVTYTIWPAAPPGG
ncbi:MAG: hypothetical protein IPN45_15790 [Actinomycetales bacterium]|nr:hypothetical protein [Actinomycetales bacterium]